MKKETLHTDLKEATGKLLEMARNQSWNSISNKCLYIISEIKDTDAENFFELRKARKRENQNKKPKPLSEVVSELKNIYQNLYDVNIRIYKSTSKLTIVEIQYYPKSSLHKDYLEEVKDSTPMLHCKVARPPYLMDDKSKFDINWELGGFRYRWNCFWWKRRAK